LGTEGRWFESSRPDHKENKGLDVKSESFFFFWRSSLTVSLVALVILGRIGKKTSLRRADETSKLPAEVIADSTAL